MQVSAFQSAIGNRQSAIPHPPLPSQLPTAIFTGNFGGPMSIRVTVWHEYRHEKRNPKVAEIYPQGMHEAIASHLRKSSDLQVRTATLDQPEHGLTDEVLQNTDVMTWWGHMAHGDVKDAIVDKLQQRILRGMGLVVL